MPKSTGSTALRYISHGTNDLFWFILPLVLPLLLIRYNLSYARAGGILSYYLAVTAVGSYFMGLISDRIPRRLIMGFGFYVAAFGLIAAGFAGSFPLFLIFLGITGIGVSTFHPAMYAHIDETFKDNKGRILGAYEASGTAAILLMFFLNGALLGHIGTRGVMTVTAVPALIMGTLLIKSRAMDAGIIQSVRPAAHEKEGDPDRHPPVILFVLFLLSIVLRIASVMAVLNFLPTIFTDHFGLPADHAAWASGLFFAGGIIGSFAASRFSRTDRSYRILILGSVLLTPLVAAMALDVPMTVHYITVVILGSIGSGLVINQNLILTKLGSRFGKGEAFGILMAVMTLSQSISPALFGLSVDKWGFPISLLIFSLPVLGSAGLLAVLSERIINITQPR
jgi:MFS family permease